MKENNKWGFNWLSNWHCCEGPAQGKEWDLTVVVVRTSDQSWTGQQEGGVSACETLEMAKDGTSGKKVGCAEKTYFCPSQYWCSSWWQQRWEVGDRVSCLVRNVCFPLAPHIHSDRCRGDCISPQFVLGCCISVFPICCEVGTCRLCELCMLCIHPAGQCPGGCEGCLVDQFCIHCSDRRAFPSHGLFLCPFFICEWFPICIPGISEK